MFKGNLYVYYKSYPQDKTETIDYQSNVSPPWLGHHSVRGASDTLGTEVVTHLLMLRSYTSVCRSNLD